MCLDIVKKTFKGSSKDVRIAKVRKHDSNV
jgi:hypothetical protein